MFFLSAEASLIGKPDSQKRNAKKVPEKCILKSFKGVDLTSDYDCIWPEAKFWQQKKKIYPKKKYFTLDACSINRMCVASSLDA